MRKLLLAFAGLGGLALAAPLPATAAPVAPLGLGVHAGATASVQPVYYYRHRYYRHRRYDRRHHRYYYY